MFNREFGEPRPKIEKPPGKVNLKLSREFSREGAAADVLRGTCCGWNIVVKKTIDKRGEMSFSAKVKPARNGTWADVSSYAKEIWEKFSPFARNEIPEATEKHNIPPAAIAMEFVNEVLRKQ